MKKRIFILLVVTEPAVPVGGADSTLADVEASISELEHSDSFRFGER